MAFQHHHIDAVYKGTLNPGPGSIEAEKVTYRGTSLSSAQKYLYSKKGIVKTPTQLHSNLTKLLIGFDGKRGF